MNVVSSIASQAFDVALALVYPQACAVCGRSVESRYDGIACSRCWNEAPLFRGDETLCWKCGALSLASVSEDKRQSIRCGRCDDDAFTAARACGLYEGALRASILELKRQPHVARRVAQLMYDVLQREPLNQADVIIPVPLHYDRERERESGTDVVLESAADLRREEESPVTELAFAAIGVEHSFATFEERPQARAPEREFAEERVDADLDAVARVRLVLVVDECHPRLDEPAAGDAVVGEPFISGSPELERDVSVQRVVLYATTAAAGDANLRVLNPQAVCVCERDAACHHQQRREHRSDRSHERAAVSGSRGRRNIGRASACVLSIALALSFVGRAAATTEPRVHAEWRAVLSGKGDGPVLTSIAAAYLQRNLRPVVRSITEASPCRRWMNARAFAAPPKAAGAIFDINRPVKLRKA